MGSDGWTGSRFNQQARSEPELSRSSAPGGSAGDDLRTAIRLVPREHATCYARALAVALARLGVTPVQLRVGDSRIEAARPAIEIEVSVQARHADQLERAIQQTMPDCLRSATARTGDQPCLNTVEVDRPHEHDTIDAPLFPLDDQAASASGARHDATVFAPLRPRPDETAPSPLGARPDETVFAPLDARPDESVPAPLRARPDETVFAPLRARQDETVFAPLPRQDPRSSHQIARRDETCIEVQVGERQPTSGGPIEAPFGPAVASGQSALRRPIATQVRQVAVGLRQKVTGVLRLAALLVAFAVVLRASVQTFRVDGPSMSPNFETGQQVVVNRIAFWHIDGTPLEGLLPVKPQGSIEYLFGGPRRGDVVTLRPPTESEFQADLIKRIIGLPGDEVSIQDGQLFINGNAVTEPYVQFPADYTFPGPDLAVRVPDSSYFVLGDNRPVSADSHLGWFVPMQNLVGEAWISYWPVGSWGIVQSGDIRGVTPDDVPVENAN